jgi:hypothetical protein
MGIFEILNLSLEAMAVEVEEADTNHILVAIITAIRDIELAAAAVAVHRSESEHNSGRSTPRNKLKIFWNFIFVIPLRSINMQKHIITVNIRNGLPGHQKGRLNKGPTHHRQPHEDGEVVQRGSSYSKSNYPSNAIDRAYEPLSRSSRDDRARGSNSYSSYK